MLFLSCCLFSDEWSRNDFMKLLVRINASAQTLLIIISLFLNRNSKLQFGTILWGYKLNAKTKSAALQSLSVTKIRH